MPAAVPDRKGARHQRDVTLNTGMEQLSKHRPR
jgi:hypothetical protein